MWKLQEEEGGGGMETHLPSENMNLGASQQMLFLDAIFVLM